MRETSKSELEQLWLGLQNKLFTYKNRTLSMIELKEEIEAQEQKVNLWFIKIIKKLCTGEIRLQDSQHKETPAYVTALKELLEEARRTFSYLKANASHNNSVFVRYIRPLLESESGYSSVDRVLETANKFNNNEIERAEVFDKIIKIAGFESLLNKTFTLEAWSKITLDDDASARNYMNSQFGVDDAVDDIVNLRNLIEKFMQEYTDVKIITIELFKDCFDENKHKYAENTMVTDYLPISSKVEIIRTDPKTHNIIWDLIGVGFESEKRSIIKKARVRYG